MRVTDAEIAELIRRGAVVRDHGVRPSGTKPPKDTGRLARSVPTSLLGIHRTLAGPCQSIWIPGWFPVLVNALRSTPGRHWAGPYTKLKSDKAIVACYFTGSGVARATGPRRVSLLFIMGKGKRLFDRDAPRKSLLDALVACGALLNDDPAHCYEGPITYARALLDCQCGTLICLEEVG